MEWLGAVRLIASEGYPTELMLTDCKCGGLFRTLLCAPFACKLSRLYDQLITLRV